MSHRSTANKHQRRAVGLLLSADADGRCRQLTAGVTGYRSMSVADARPHQRAASCRDPRCEGQRRLVRVKYTMCQKERHQTHGSNSLNSQTIFNFFHSQILHKICSKVLIRDLTECHMRR